MVGPPNVPEYVTLKPKLADPPTPMLPFHVFLTVTVWPLAVYEPSHSELTLWLEGR